jgi:hypothetical protein
LLASVCQAPPAWRIASSRIVGVPLSIEKRMRTSWPRSPVQAMVSALSAIEAASPAAVL